MADRLETYSKWLVDNEADKDSDQWKSVAADYNALRSGAPELVAGTPQQKRRATEVNIRNEIGTTEPVKLPESKAATTNLVDFFRTDDTASLFQRFMRGVAKGAGPDDLQIFDDYEFGKNKHVTIGNNTLIQVPDKKGGEEWIIANPRGLEGGDIAEAAANLPQLITGITAGLALVPGPQAGPAKLAQLSGASALASGVAGFIQDAALRIYTEQNIRPGEIFKRRGPEAALDATLGFLLPFGAQKFINGRVVKKAVKNFVGAFESEGKAAMGALRKAGAKITTTQDSGDAVRALVPGNVDAAKVGEELASQLTKFDETLRTSGTGLTRGAARNAADRGRNIIDQAAPPITLTPAEVGKLATTGVQKDAVQAKATVTGLYDAAYKEINTAVQSGKNTGGDFIISLDNTKQALNSAKKSLMRTVDGEPSDLYAGMLSTLKKLDDVADATQRLEAVRSTRSMIGQRLRGDGGEFANMEEGAAKQLYKSLSLDIEQSVARYSGPGADALKAADTQYAKLLGKYESNSFLAKLEKGGFDNPEQVIKDLANGGTEDWALLQSTLPPNTFNAVRRSVMDGILDSQTARVAGEEVVDIAKMGSTLRGIAPEVKNVIFGNPRVWTSLQKVGEEMAFIQRSAGLLTRPALPSKQALQEITEEAKSLGVDRINQQFWRAVKAAETRRDNIGDAIASQINSGNVSTLTGNPELMLDTIVFSGNYGPKAVANMIVKLPPQAREDMSAATFQSIFERAKDASASTVGKGVASYSPEVMLQKVFGSERQREVIKTVVGPERFALIENWTKFTNAKAMARKVTESGGNKQKLTSLIASAPFKYIFAARAASAVLERAPGRAFIASATPEAAELFSQARLLESDPKKTAAGIALLQRVLNMPNYGNYRDMMSELPPEQRDALDQYLND